MNGKRDRPKSVSTCGRMSRKSAREKREGERETKTEREREREREKEGEREKETGSTDYGRWELGSELLGYKLYFLTTQKDIFPPPQHLNHPRYSPKKFRSS